MGNKMELRILSGLCLLMLVFGQDFLITDSQIDSSISQTSLDLEDVQLGDEGTFNYSNQGGWGGECNKDTSKKQSPINIPPKKAVAIKPTVVSKKETSRGQVYFTCPLDLSEYKVDSENYYKVTPPATFACVMVLSGVDNSENSIKGGKVAQFHFHAPSEHQIDGKSLPLEMHVVFTGTTTTKPEQVVSVLFEEGTENAQLANLAKNASVNLKKLVGAKEITVKLAGNDNKQQDALGKVYYYTGSLTTPDCDEGIQWVVNAEVQKASKDQIKKFTDLWKGVKNIGTATGNNRKVQELNDRTVYSFGLSEPDDDNDTHPDSGKLFGLVALLLALIL